MTNRKLLILAVLAAVLAIAAAAAPTATASYLCGTPHGSATVNDFPCWPARDIVDKAYTVHIYGDQTGFMVDGYAVECYRDPGYILCIPYPAAPDSWVLFGY